MKVGYVRVSTAEQNTERQEILMEQLRVEKIFIDKCSGKNANRPKLMEMMNFVREGDTVIVESISRFARNTKDLLTLVEQLTEMGVQFESQKEKIDTSTPAGQFMLTVFGAMSELEREYILARQKEGIEAKKARGEYKGRQPIEVDKSQFEQEYKLWKSGQITATTAMSHLGLKPNTFYRRVKEYDEKHNVAGGTV
ncbi:MAG: recombinase family protein [Oscillospiraceae bacterium]|nr:recombinase family protein [Oscillospiraceae bacterium]